jgi:hypothetical protein
MRKYTFFADPGHGWLRVKRSELAELGLLNAITPYSYENGKYVYLEEDCDATVFFGTLYVKYGITLNELRPHIKERHSNNPSAIRKYKSYYNPTYTGMEL